MLKQVFAGTCIATLLLNTACIKANTQTLKAEGADVVAIAKAAGFWITTEDLNTHRQKLSDEDLEGVAGGEVSFWCCFLGTTTDSCCHY